ncbi:MAG: hypothetical protein IJ072_04270 [Oscillospiraceae bacterium]|nr:hypothetical protein [Oscillospiraceae bacterium]
MATLTELAEQYRQGAQLLKRRIEELTGQMESIRGETERLRMRGRLNALGTMYRQACETAGYLHRYYDTQGDGHGRG